MRVIKRYSNRKLYDTQSKQYITLEQIADLVRTGEELQVIENISGDDLTAQTLSQVILEQEKKQKNFIPRSVLSALVEAGGKPLSSIRQRLEAPLGFLYHVDDEIERRIQLLIQRGEIAEDHGQKLRDQLMEQNPLLVSHNNIKDEDIQRALQNQDIPTSDDIQDLLEQIEALTKKINALE